MPSLAVLFPMLFTCLFFLSLSGPCSADDLPFPPPTQSSELLKDSPYREADFSYSKDPNEVLISVLTAGGMSMYRRTIDLYGDGQLICRKFHRKRLEKEENVQIPPAEVDKLLRLAVDYGLAEWDLTRVQAKQIEKNDGKLYSGIPSDAPRDSILLFLTDYERGSYRRSEVRKEVAFHGASSADRFYPSILEIRGILELKKALYGHRAEAKL